MTVRLPSICDICAWKDGFSSCKAYPEGIPGEILNLEVDHRQPHEGDNGITFVLRDGEDPEYVGELMAIAEKQFQKAQEPTVLG